MSRLRHMTLVLLSCAAATSGCSRSAESTVERFYQAVARGEITEARGYLSSQVMGTLGQQKVTGALAAEAKRIQQCGGIRTIEVQLTGQGEIRSGTAIVTYTGTCPEKREKVSLIQENGAWKLGATK